jgi:hypothetical protein
LRPRGGKLSPLLYAGVSAETVKWLLTVASTGTIAARRGKPSRMLPRLKARLALSLESTRLEVAHSPMLIRFTLRHPVSWHCRGQNVLNKLYTEALSITHKRIIRSCAVSRSDRCLGQPSEYRHVDHEPHRAHLRALPGAFLSTTHKS